MFIDSDIIINTNSIKLLIDSPTDITGCLYIVPWSGKMTVGLIIRDNFYMKHVEDVDEILYHKCNILGFGCTIGSIEHGRQSYTGEDIGFFIECHEKNMSVSYISSVNHKYKN